MAPERFHSQDPHLAVVPPVARIFPDVFDASNERQRNVLEALQRGVEGILTSDGYQAYLKTMSRFHRYSFANSLLIHVQNPDATRVAGYHTWRQLGRQVKKGEKAIKIYVPYKHKEVDEATGEEGWRVTGFGVGHVFDIGSTDGEPLPEAPTLIESENSNDVAAELNRRLGWWGVGEGLRMESKAINGHARGYWNPTARQIVVRRDEYVDEDGSVSISDPLSTMKTKTLAHELAHYIGGHSNHTPRDDAEVVAESAAFVTLNHFGLETTNYSFGYVAGWAGNFERLRKSLAEVQRVATVLISIAERSESPSERDDGFAVTDANE